MEESVTARLRPGLTGEAQIVVGEDDRMGRATGNTRVLSTPSMIALMEAAAQKALTQLLPEGWSTVGTMVNVRHLAATPVGKAVVARAELLEINGRKLLFSVEAHNPQRKIGEGTHERAIIHVGDFRKNAGSEGD